MALCHEHRHCPPPPLRKNERILVKGGVHRFASLSKIQSPKCSSQAVNPRFQDRQPRPHARIFRARLSAPTMVHPRRWSLLPAPRHCSCCAVSNISDSLMNRLTPLRARKLMQATATSACSMITPRRPMPGNLSAGSCQAQRQVRRKPLACQTDARQKIHHQYRRV